MQIFKINSIHLIAKDVSLGHRAFIIQTITGDGDR